MISQVHAQEYSTGMLGPQRHNSRRISQFVFDKSTDNANMETQARTNLARNVKRLRQRAQLSQMKLAKKSGIAQTAISYIERLATKSPTLEVIEALARSFRVPVWAMLMDLDDMSDDQIKQFALLCEEFTHLSPESRMEVMRVTDREHRYSEMKAEKNHARTM